MMSLDLMFRYFRKVIGFYEIKKQIRKIIFENRTKRSNSRAYHTLRQAQGGKASTFS
jgi:hypothetical protein